MKRMLFSVALLITMGVLVGCQTDSTPQTSHPQTSQASGSLYTSDAPILLAGSKSSSTSSTITFADRWRELFHSQWEGSWETVVEGFSSGPAELFLVTSGDNTVRAKFLMSGGAAGTFTFWRTGTTKGNTMEVTGGTSTVVLSLFREKGVLVLKGKYDVTSGPRIGESGTLSFKKK